MTTNSTKKGYVFGFVEPTSPDYAQYSALAAPTVKAYGGRVLAKQLVKDAIYKENADDFSASFVLEFPSLTDALDWYNSEDYREAKKLRRSTSKGPFAILEGGDVGEYKGFSTFFIKVNDRDSFSKYSPVESLQLYSARRSVVAIDQAPVAEDAEAYDVAVLIAFPKAEDGKAWLESAEYKPDGDLRLATTSGPGAIIGSVKQN